MHINMWVLFVLLPVFADLFVNLKSHWKGPSKSTLAQEASECLWEIDPSLFWQLIDRPTNWEELLSPELKELCWFSLWNREYSARMEFFSALERATAGSSECGVAVSHGRVACGDLRVYDSDHVYRRGDTTLVAYLDVNDPGFVTAHQAVAKHAREVNATYVLRHTDTRTDSEDLLGGYGAELLVRDMEYKPLEDTSIELTTDEGNWNLASTR